MTPRESTIALPPRPEQWRHAIQAHPDWLWRGEKLWHRAAEIAHVPDRRVTKFQSGFVAHIYADQNRSSAVRRALGSLLESLGAGAVAVNIGAGGTRFDRVLNLEISDGPNVDIVGHGSELPFKDNTVDLVIAQEVLEHVADFIELVREIHRVLKPGGAFFCQVPFQIGFHPGPSDYWRFTRQGLEHLFSEPRWQRQELTISLGHGSGFYRIAVEFFAVTVSCVSQPLYRPAKGAAAVLLYPLKWFDLLTSRSAERDRIPGGYFCIARKLAGENGAMR